MKEVVENLKYVIDNIFHILNLENLYRESEKCEVLLLCV